MRKERINSLVLFAGCLTLLLVGTAKMEIKDEPTSEVMVIEERPATPFTTFYKEPMIIEKEVIVEKEVIIEVPTTIIEERVIQLQPISYEYDVFEPTNLTEADLIDALGEVRSGLHPIAGAVADAEAIHGVNSIYLLATLGLESGWGKYRSAYNNIAGWKRGDGSGFRDFDSLYDCVMTVAEGLSSSFSETHGSMLGDVTSRYCPESDYLDKIMVVMNELQNNLY